MMHGHWERGRLLGSTFPLSHVDLPSDASIASDGPHRHPTRLKRMEAK
eukprot:CAMPEP_0204274986 /NCGR_PEP_ID=MMETSP0468-20130131/25498_1 /ASSEMBLY_ACC=CAM_ASM_000383 /TAXON_ID=2969 /ORGANISM="Oxyrrhis marina" /LENGTH=47 /DNA_ID= /DNA_START= /DNA_END= /DNA_ORIENTATION=